MPEDLNWGTETPFSATPDAAALRRVFKFVSANLFWLAGGVAAGVALGLAAQHFLPTTHEAEGSFVVDEVPYLQKNNRTDYDTRNDLVQSLILAIPSFHMQSMIAADLGVPAKQICFTAISRRLSLRSKVPVANIRITSVHGSRTGTISVTSQRAKFAAQVVNALLDELDNYNLAQGRLNELDLQVQSVTARSESIHGQLAQVRQALNWQEQQVAQLDEYEKKGLPVESFPDFVSDTTLNNLKTERLLDQTAYAALASSGSGLQVKEKKAKVEEDNKEVERQAQLLAEGQRSQLAATRLQEHNLQIELRDTLLTLQKLGHERAAWVQSFGDIARMKKMIADRTIGQNQRGSAIVVVNRAVPVERAKSPKLWLNLLVGIFIGGLAGFLIAITRTSLDDRLASPQMVAALTHLPCVMTIPRRNILSWIGKKRSPGCAGFDRFRSRLLLTAPSAEIHIIGFTPARKRENASLVVADLAMMLSRAGHRVLVVDLHFSKPRQSRLLKIKPRRGLADWMASDNDIEDYIWPAELPELALLSCAPNMAPAGDLIARRPLAKILPQFKNSWDFILIDAPAILSCWNLTLALPEKSELIITASRRRTRARQVAQTSLAAQHQSWRVAGVALLNC